MKIPTNVFEEGVRLFRNHITSMGKRIVRVTNVTLPQAKKTVVLTYSTGAAGGGGVVLYDIATAEDHEGTKYTHYYGDDGNMHVENHRTGRIVGL